MIQIKPNKFQKKLPIFLIIAVLLIGLSMTLVVAQQVTDERIQLNQGLNLISVMSGMINKTLADLNSGQSCTDFVEGSSAFMYDNGNKDWLAVQNLGRTLPDFVVNIDTFQPEHVGMGLWVKVQDACELSCGPNGCTSASDQDIDASLKETQSMRLSEGLNLLSVTPAMVGKSLNEIGSIDNTEESCTDFVEGSSAFMYDNGNKDWLAVQNLGRTLPDFVVDIDTFQPEHVGMGLWVKTKDNCNLGCGLNKCEISAATRDTLRTGAMARTVDEIGSGQTGSDQTDSSGCLANECGGVCYLECEGIRSFSCTDRALCILDQPKTTCRELTYPTDKWERNWRRVGSTGECLFGNPQDEPELTFDNNWGDGVLDYGIKDNIMFESSRRITVPESGNYRFWVNSDDGVRMWIDGQLIANSWHNQYFSGDSGCAIQLSTLLLHVFGKCDKIPFTPSWDVFLIQGEHDIRIDYYEDKADARLSFDYIFIS